MKKPEDMTPAEIKAEIEDLGKRLSEGNARLFRLRLRLALDACPYQVGEVLVNRLGQRGRVDAIHAQQYGGEGYQLSGIWLKKDGTPAMNPGRDNTSPRVNGFSSWEEWKREGEGSVNA